MIFGLTIHDIQVIIELGRLRTDIRGSFVNKFTDFNLCLMLGNIYMCILRF
jgi:hypothetical protein